MWMYCMYNNFFHTAYVLYYCNMHLQQYDKNYCVYLARIGRHGEKAGGNVTTHAQHRIIWICIIYAGTVANCVELLSCTGVMHVRVCS